MTDPAGLVDRVVEAYGGAQRWRTALAASGSVALGGQLFRLKGVTLPPQIQITTALDHPHARLAPIDRAGHVGEFDRDDVSLQDPDGAVIERREGARGHMLRPDRMGRGWDTLDLTYFLGQAFWGYNALVRWLLRDDVGRREVQPGVLELTLPAGTPAHCLTQRFHFTDDGLLKRNDYHPEVVTHDPRMWVANLVRRHGRWEAVPYPSRRRVRPRPRERPLPAPTFVSIDVSGWHLLD